MPGREHATSSLGGTPDWAPAAVLDTLHAMFLARALYVVTRLGVPDLLAVGPRSCVDLAAELHVQPRPLHQVIRAVASTGLFAGDPGSAAGPEQVFRLTPLGATLCVGHLSGTRDLVLTMQGAVVQDSLAALPDRIATGRTGPELSRGMRFFEYLAEHPEEAASFNRMMIATHRDAPAAVARAYDLTWARTIVDVGGGLGGLVLSLLEHNSQLTGTVFDLPDVVEHAKKHIAGSGWAHRCDTTGGDFFEAVPAGSDAYLLSRVLHDWDDESCVRILRTCAAAMRTSSRLLIVEMVLPADDRPHPGKTLDLIMATLTNGVERTAGEYREILVRAGLCMNAVIPTDAPVSVIEATVAGS